MHDVQAVSHSPAKEVIDYEYGSINDIFYPLNNLYDNKKITASDVSNGS